MAHRIMRSERSEHTLQPTALVHEAFIRFLGRGEIEFRDRTHFYALVSRTMHRILTDYSRAKVSSKRGGDFVHVDHQQLNELSSDDTTQDLVFINEILDELQEREPKLAQIVELRLFAGFTDSETAEILGRPLRSIQREWQKIRGYLKGLLENDTRQKTDRGVAADAKQPFAGPGTLIANRYAIEQKIGSGGFSTVYSARDIRHNELVALKLFTKASKSPFALRTLAAQELRALRALKHPNIPALLDAGEIAHRVPFVVTEYHEGCSLRHVIQSSQLSHERVLQILLDVSNALKAAHSANILHLDIKPENILIGKTEIRPQSFLIDFGSAWIENTHELQFRAGSPAYMAPELLKGKPSVKSDIFALGVIAFEMITGVLPEAESSLQEIEQVLRRWKVHTELTRIIARSMALDERYRVESAERFNNLIEAINPAKYV